MDIMDDYIEIIDDNIIVESIEIPMQTQNQRIFKKCIVFTCCCCMIIFIGLFIYGSIKYF